MSLWLTILLLGPPVSAPQALTAKVAEASRYFSKQEIDRAASFDRVRHLLFILRHGLTFGFLLLFAWSPLGRRTASWCEAWATSRIVGEAIYVALLLFLFELVRFPLAYYAGYQNEHAYGLSTQSLGGFLLDHLKGFGLSFALEWPCLVLLLEAIRRFPRGWFLMVFGGAMALMLLLVMLAPIVIAPLFNKFTPVADTDLLARIDRLAGKAGIQVDQVLEMDASRRTRRQNAYFTGFFGTRRVVLYDTLVEESDRDEVEVTLAHEFGHWEHRHIQKGMAVSALGVAASLLFIQFLLPILPGELRRLPAILFVASTLGLLAQPFALRLSRGFEAQADGESLALSCKPEAFIRSEVKLAKSNLSPIHPSRFFLLMTFSHPPVLDRIAMAEAWGARSN